ncbi:MAG: hypothetical protein SOV71_06855 [Anaerovoracaceae bacterium]|nr:hypothetical protein [Bacillota bacterium]MDY2671257.1 hypothetical protein [Anaerovoracaceae bacterium]
MELVRHNKFQRLFLPGFIFQSMVIGGGYGTGAEMAQYFGVSGVMGGLLTCIVVAIVWSVISMVTYEFARVFRTYDYHSLTDKLLGRGSILYEITYLAASLMVLGVVIATSGSMFNTMFHANKWIGSFILAALICLFIISGTKVVERVFAFWSYVLYAVYIVFFIIVFVKFGSNISANLGMMEVKHTWFSNGLIYSSYNLGIVAAVLYSTDDQQSRKEAYISGALTGVIAILPAVFLFLALSAFYPDFLTLDVPVNLLFEKLNMPWLYVLFEIVLFGTLIETGMGFIKAITDRVEVSYQKKSGEAPKWVRPTITIGFVVIGLLISKFGITAIILKGYGAMPYAYLITLIIPLFTIGIYKLVKHGPTPDQLPEGEKIKE